jgi:hypothetical protein
MNLLSVSIMVTGRSAISITRSSGGGRRSNIFSTDLQKLPNLE